jgi:hypothetical protein
VESAVEYEKRRYDGGEEGRLLWRMRREAVVDDEEEGCGVG